MLFCVVGETNKEERKTSEGKSLSGDNQEERKDAETNCLRERTLFKSGTSTFKLIVDAVLSIIIILQFYFKYHNYFVVVF